jgi:Icc protein
MNRSDPFDELDGCGDGSVDVLAAGHVDKRYNLWSRNPVTVSAAYLDADGASDRPAAETDVNY